MKPYNIEIFDRQFNYRYNALLDESYIVYKYDILSPEKNTLNIPKDIDIRITDNEGSMGDGSICTGDYIRISRDDSEYTGIISKVEKDKNSTIITYMSILQLFNHEVYVKADDIKFSTIEDYLYLLLEQEFISTSDLSQKIYGLTLTKSSQTLGIFDYCYTNEIWTTINLLNDYISPAFKDFLVNLNIQIDIPNKAVNVNIGKINESDIKSIEGDLPNILSSDYVIRQSNDATNKLTLVDTYNNLYDKYTFYLHASDYSFNQTDNDRITPVINNIEEFDSSIITEEAYWSEVNNTLPTIQKYLQYSGTLTNTELSVLAEALNKVFPYYKRVIDAQINSYEYYRAKVADEITDMTSMWYPLTAWDDYFLNWSYNYKNVNWNDEVALTEYVDDYYLYRNFTFRISEYKTSISANDLDFRTPLRGTLPSESSMPYTETSGTNGSRRRYSDETCPAECKLVITQSTASQGDNWLDWQVGRRNMIRYSWYPTGGGQTVVERYPYYPNANDTYSHVHLILPVSIDFKANVPNNGIVASYSMLAYLNIPVTYSDLTSAIDAYKQTPEYQEAYARYKREKFTYLLEAYANKTFKTSRFTNNIEITVKADDTMIKPLEMNIGQIVKIIHKGVEYNSILTGREVKGGLVKLIFGNIRLELTKILNMKGV